MPIQWCSNFQFSGPLDAGAISITPSGSSGAFSSWVEAFVADADCVLTGIILHEPGTTVRFQVEVGVSVGGGGETVIAAAGGQSNSNNAFGNGLMPCRIPIDAIPNGASVRVRFKKTGTNATVWKFALTYFKKPIVGTILTTAQPQLVTDVLTAPTIAIGAVAAWTNSSWATIWTPSADSVITGYWLGFVTNGEDFILDLGVSSTPIWTVKEQQGLADYPVYHAIKHPLLVASGAAVQGRWRKLANSALSLPVAFTYHELPL